MTMKIEKRFTRLEVPETRSADLAKATSAVTAAKIEIERLQARVASLENKPTAPAAKPSEPTTAALAECAKAAFGEGFLNQMANVTKDEAEFRDRLCRAFHMHDLKVPNLDLSAQVKKVGEYKVSGLQLIESSRMQEAINATLQKLK